MKKIITMGIALLVMFLSINNVFAETTTEKKEKTTKTGCVKRQYSYYDPKKVSGPHYDTPTISFNGPVYDRALTKDDFSAKERKYYYYKKRKVTVTYYTSKRDTSTTNYTCSKSGSRVYGSYGNKYQDRVSYPKLDVSTPIEINDQKKSQGYVTYQVTARGSNGTATKNAKSYWVKSVNIETSEKDVYFSSSYSPNFTCTVTYGNGVTGSCENVDTTGTLNIISNKKTIEETNVKHPYFEGFLVKHENNGVLTQPTNYAGRVSDYYKNLGVNRSKVSTFSGTTNSTINGSIQSKNSYDFGDIYIISYKDKHTGKSDTEVNRSWKMSVLDVEDETREPEKKEAYAQQRIWNDGQYRKDVLEDVTCNLYYFGPMEPKNCIDDVEVEMNYEYFNYKHVFGTESIDPLLGGRIPTIGNWYEYIKYFIDVDGEYFLQDQDYRTIIYSSEVSVNNGYFRTDDNRNFEGEGNPEQDVIVKETHEKDVKTEKSYPTHENYAWHGFEEEYENFVMPTCERTYAPSKISGEQLVEDCADDMFYQFDSIWADYQSVSGKEYWYKLGKERRTGKFIYLENGLQSFQTINFHYTTDIDIQISDDYTYQDELYPNYTCTKTYPSLNNTTRSCLDRMFIESDTGQNMNMDGEREVVYRYVNNDYEDTKKMIRVYANDTKILDTTPSGDPIKTEGISGTRQEYQCEVVWQDHTTKDVTYEKDTWSSDILSKNYIPGPKVWENLNETESLNFIGDDWVDGYVDKKGVQHKPNSINELYLADPISKQYRVNCEYPQMTYNNGLTGNGMSGWAYTDDKYAPGVDGKPFYVMGVDTVEIWDDTSRFHGNGSGIDIDRNGARLTSSFGDIKGESYDGSQNNAPPSSLLTTDVKAFNHKTYQTGHWYDFQAVVTFDASPTTGQNEVFEIEDVNNTLPEVTFSYISDIQRNKKAPTENALAFRVDKDGYPSSEYDTVDTQFPEVTTDHRIPQDDWNGIRFDFMTESGLQSPENNPSTGLEEPQGNDEEKMKAKLFEEVWFWSHSPVSMRIEGPIGSGATEAPPTAKFGQDYAFQSFLLWSDGYEKDQALYNGYDGNYVGNDHNPWGSEHKKPMNVTGLPWTGWKTTEYGNVSTSNDEIVFSFSEFKGNNNKRTVASWWGDEDAGSGYVGQGFRFWDYFFQEIEILIDDEANACADIDVPKRDCPLPIDGVTGDNYRMPQNSDIKQNRLTIFGIDFNVTGISKGNGR